MPTRERTPKKFENGNSQVVRQGRRVADAVGGTQEWRNEDCVIVVD